MSPALRSPKAPAAQAESPSAQPGFFGKLPMRGDFVTRRMEARCRAAFDEWLSACITASRRRLGDRWGEIYAHAPAWRFVLAAGIAGPDPIAGVMLPSADHYGRQFPLVIALELPGLRQPFELMLRAEAWFGAAEAAGHSARAAEASLESFDQRVLELGRPASGVEPEPDDIEGAARHFPLGDEMARVRAYAGALSAAMCDVVPELSLWWTVGAAGVAPCLLQHRGLPEPTRFGALLDGGWSTWGWSPGFETAVDSVAPEDLTLGPIRSAMRTHAGGRSKNRNATLERPDLGLWVLADEASEEDFGAAALVIGKLEAFQPPLSFGSALTELEELLGEANEMLLDKGRPLGPERVCAAVTAALVIHDGRYAVVWAGNSRVYLRRDGRLQRLTRDHASDEGRYVTRAIGAASSLALDALRGEVRPGDRFVLCSGGLTRHISDRMLETALRRGRAAEVAGELIEDALIGGADDNITALVVDVEGGG